MGAYEEYQAFKDKAPLSGEIPYEQFQQWKTTQSQPMSTLSKIAGFPLTRLALGAASPFLGAAELAGMAGDVLATRAGTQPLGVGQKVSEFEKRVEEAKRRGMQYWYGKANQPEKATGIDWFGLLGSAVGPATSMAGRLLPTAKTGLGRIGQGGLMGAGFGAATPVGSQQDFWKTKQAQIGLGAATGAGLSGTVEASKTVGTWGRELFDVFRAGGPEAIVTKYQQSIIGEQNLPTVQRALRTVPTYVPGSRPTAAEALVGTPAGSPIQSHQRVVSQLPGGPSAEFGQRLTEKDVARLASRAATDALTDPMRAAALSGANVKGGVATPKLLADIYDIANKPGMRASDVVQKTLGDVREKIALLAGKKLKVDANDLYTVRKELGNTIRKYALESQNWDKRLTSGLTRQVQKVIDDSIESSGGVGWKQYLETYAKQAQRLEMDVTRQTMMYKPTQRTSLGGQALKQEELAALPHILTRSMVVGNWLLNLFKQDIQPAVQAEAARRYLNPSAMAEALSKRPPLIDPRVWDVLMRTAIAGGATGAAQQVTP